MKLFLSLFIIFLFTFEGMAATILIDPGHGGEDQGARGFGGKSRAAPLEKDFCLIFAKKIMKALEKKHRVYLTRSVDKTLSLEKRAELADKINADLFVSVHLNGSKRRGANGFETYYLDHHKDAAVKRIEEVENVGLEGEAAIINSILADLVVERTTKASRSLAQNIHLKISRKMKRKYKMKDRGIKPGLFFVLALTKRPAVLLEVGFLTNTREAKKMSGKKFQDDYAKAVADGIESYLSSIKKK